jgi:ribosomal protein S18 acetylase RimI-like enzyme
MSTILAPEPPAIHHEKHKTWTRDGFLISTDPSLISLDALTAAFASDYMYWAKPLPPADMQAMIANSLCFGLYTPTPALPPSTAPEEESSRPPITRTATTGSSMIGFARVITDSVTTVYLTDVYVLPEWQGTGLGRWLIECVQTVFEGMPHLRRSFLITGRGGKAVGFYEKFMSMETMDEGRLVAMSWRGAGSIV